MRILAWIGLILAGLFTSATLATADDLPKPTPEGVDALTRLIDRGVAGGGLRVVKPPGGGDPHYEVIDEARLREIIEANRPMINRPLIDALIGGWSVFDEPEETMAIAWLRAIGAKTGDERAAGFGEVFAGQVAARSRGAKGAVTAFDEAARHFLLAGDPGWQATSLHEAGLVLRGLGELGQAIDHYRRALEIRRATLPANDPLIATTLNNLGVAYEESGDFRLAETYLRQALAIRELILPANDPALASSYRNLSSVDYKTSRIAEAIDLQSRALAIRRVHAADSPTQLADALNGLGVLRSEKRELREALLLFQESLEILERLGPKTELQQAETLGNIGVAAERAGDYPKALDLFGRVLEIRQRRLPPRHPQIAYSLGLLSKLQGDMGDYQSALENGEKALTLRRQFYGPIHADVARSVNNLGGIHRQRGDEPRALESFREALKIWRDAYRRPHPEIGYCLDNIAGILGRQGDWSGALEGHREALAILEATLGPNHPEVAACWLGLGATDAAAGRQAESMQSYRRAVEVSRAAGPAGQPGLVPALNNLAVAKVRVGDPAGAEKDLSEALEIARKVLGPHHTSVARTLTELASIRSILGDHLGARRRIDEAIATLNERPGVSGLPVTATSFDLLARRARILEDNLGEAPEVNQIQECADAYESAASLLERLRGRVVVSSEGKLQVVEEASDLFPRLVGVRTRLARVSGAEKKSQLRAAFEASERGVARLFLDTLGRSRADRLGGVASDLLVNASKFQTQIEQIDRQLDSERGQPVERRRPEVIGLLDDRRLRLDEELRQLVDRMDREYPRYAALKSPSACRLEEARGELAEDEVALIYVTGLNASYLILLSKTGMPETDGLAIYPLPPGEALAELVARMTFPKNLADVDSTRDLGVEAYRILIGPAAETIREKALVIVAGGSLGSLPFELLVEPKDREGRRFLIEGHRIRYAPSMTSLRLLGSRGKPGLGSERPFWAMGDPIYQPSDSRLAGENPPRRLDASPTIRPSLFERLPATSGEVDRLASLMNAESGEIFLGRSATEGKVKRLSEAKTLAHYRYLHFATHGVLESDQRKQPALVLSLLGDEPGEDGYLTLDEVIGLKLGAELVVLSACRTGQGKINQGEGVSGLARAFLYAGSLGVVCSLWQVDDASTADLMIDFYSRLKAGKTPAEALRESRVTMIEAGEPPLHWAPFILIGK